MIILSITFHTDENQLKEWECYMNDVLMSEIKGFERKFILSEVDTEMLSEGRNTNLLLFFENQEEINIFLEQKFLKISQNILTQFQESILIFKTILKNINTNI